jgi:transcriptional regulator
MYQPKHFEETSDAALRALISASPLATFIICSDKELVANHIPFVLAGPSTSFSQLQAHIPRANPLNEALLNGKKCMAIFHGPEGYISPSYYATKPKHGKVVPTWNYSVVHVHGTAKTIDDPVWVRRQMVLLTKLKEDPRSVPWEISDAPEEFINALLKSLVGIEVSIERVEGKTKASQNQPEENQQSVLQHMEHEGGNEELMRLMRTVLNRDG